MRFVLCTLLTVCLSSSVFAQSFKVVSQTPNAKRYEAQAQRYYTNVSTYWFGKAHPNLWKPVRITVREGRMGAGGSSSFSYVLNEQTGETHVVNISMTTQGTTQRIFDSVIPHEVAHVVIHVKKRKPFSRFFDEGMAAIWEHQSELAHQHATLRQHLNSLPPSKVWMDEISYPSDMKTVLRLYAQGWWMTSCLLEQFGKEKFIAFILDDRKPTEKFESYFGMNTDEYDKVCVETYKKQYVIGAQSGSYRRSRGTFVAPQKAKEKPVVIVFTANFPCKPCEAFKKDYKAAKFARSRFQFKVVVRGSNEYVALEKELRAKRGHGVTGFPSFWVYKTASVQDGYGGPKGLLGFLMAIPQAIFHLIGNVLGVGGTSAPPGWEAVPVPKTIPGKVKQIKTTGGVVKDDLLQLKQHMSDMKNAGALGKLLLIPKLKADKEKLQKDLAALKAQALGLKDSVTKNDGVIGTVKEQLFQHATQLTGLDGIKGQLEGHKTRLEGLKTDVTDFKNATGPLDKLKAGVKLMTDAKTERAELRNDYESANKVSKSGWILAGLSTLASMFLGRHLRHAIGKVDETYTDLETQPQTELQEPTDETTQSTTI